MNPISFIRPLQEGLRPLMHPKAHCNFLTQKNISNIKKIFEKQIHIKVPITRSRGDRDGRGGAIPAVFSIGFRRFH